MFGEDVAAKGGVYGVTRGLLKRAGAGRVFDTVLDEQSILGLALGAGVTGLLPVPEIQYLAYLHNAEDQLRGEAATLQFFSQGQYRNPMVVRVAGYGYQKGFGGHFHNDDAVGVLRDIPGLVIASPARPDDAAAMLRTCLAAAAIDGSVCVFLEPIALYHTTRPARARRPGWLCAVRRPRPGGRRRTCRSARPGPTATVGTSRSSPAATGCYLSLRVARRLAGERASEPGWSTCAGWPRCPSRTSSGRPSATGRVLVVDETRRTGGRQRGGR